MKWNMRELVERLLRYSVPAVLLLLAAGNLTMTAWLGIRLDDLERRGLTSHHPPCEAIPMSLVAADPECADALLHAMNITNVHVLPYGSPVPGMDENTTARLKILLAVARNQSRYLNASGSR